MELVSVFGSIDLYPIAFMKIDTRVLLQVDLLKS